MLLFLPFATLVEREVEEGRGLNLWAALPETSYTIQIRYTKMRHRHFLK